MMNDPHIVISVVCYNNEDEVIAFAKQISEQSFDKNIQLIITCNSTKKIEYLKDAVNEVSIDSHIFNPEKNLGYLSGCLYGLERTKLPDYYWLMICNTDLILESKTFFEDVLDGVDSDVWCIGPSITLKTTGKEQNPFFVERPSKWSMLIRKIAYSHYLLYKTYFKLSDVKCKTKKMEKKHSSQQVYAVHGSCFLLNSDVIPLLVKESQNIFMYGEELLVSELIRGYGKKVFYNADTKIIHNENQVTGKIANSKKQQWFKQSTDYLYRRFFK